MPFKSYDYAISRVTDVSWALISPVVYIGKDEAWTVPVGFVTDFATVPQFVTWLFPRYGAYTLAAILHDWFCTIEIKDGLISARDADGVFRRIMKEEGVPFLRRWMMWTGVRWSALFSPIRRAGWWRDAPKIVLLTLLSLPLVLPASVLTGIGLLADKLLERID